MIAPGPAWVVRSSASLQWRGLLLKKHFCTPGARASASIDRHVLSKVAGGACRFEYCTAAGNFVTCLNRPGSIMITPLGRVQDLRLHTASELNPVRIGRRFHRGVIDELDRPPAPRRTFHPGIQDKSIRRIIGLLAEELEADRPLGRLYVDSLAHALATRYLLDGAAAHPESRVSALPPRVLNRVREEMEANLDADLRLRSLAEESGYSRAHFLRMFRAATGLTPHQYVLDLRLTRSILSQAKGLEYQ